MAKKLLGVIQRDFKEASFTKDFLFINNPVDIVKEMTQEIPLEDRNEGVIIYLTKEEYKKFSRDKNYQLE